MKNKNKKPFVIIYLIVLIAIISTPVILYARETKKNKQFMVDDNNLTSEVKNNESMVNDYLDVSENKNDDNQKDNEETTTKTTTNEKDNENSLKESNTQNKTSDKNNNSKNINSTKKEEKPLEETSNENKNNNSSSIKVENKPSNEESKPTTDDTKPVETKKPQIIKYYESITHGKKEFATEKEALDRGEEIANNELNYVISQNKLNGENTMKPDINYYRVYPSVIDEEGHTWYYLHFFCQSGENNDDKLKSMY